MDRREDYVQGGSVSIEMYFNMFKMFSRMFVIFVFFFFFVSLLFRELYILPEERYIFHEVKLIFTNKIVYGNRSTFFRITERRGW